MPVPCRADTSTTMVSPPHASGTSPRSESCWSTRVASASGRSILLTATMIGTSAAVAWSIASIVCGITPSSAATTSTTMSVACAPRARMAVKAAWPGVSMNVIRLSCHTHLVGADVLGDAPGLAGHHVGRADAVEQERLAVIDVPHHGHHRRPRTLVRVLLFVLFLEVARQQLGFLLLAGVDQADVGADLGGEELDHVVGQRLRRHDHFTLEHEEADDVACAAVQLGPEVACRRSAFDDDLAVGHRGGRRLVAGELRRLELFEVAPAPTGATLRRAPSGQTAATGGGRRTRRSSSAGTSTESPAGTAGTAGEAAAAWPTWASGRTPGAGRRSTSGACGVAAAAGSRRAARSGAGHPCRVVAESDGRWARSGAAGAAAAARACHWGSRGDAGPAARPVVPLARGLHPPPWASVSELGLPVLPGPRA